MELKKRFKPNDVVPEIISEEGNTETLEPGIPPRRLVHSHKIKRSSKFAWGYSISLIALLLVLGGSWWWMKSQLSEGATPISKQAMEVSQAAEEPQKNQIQADKHSLPAKPPAIPTTVKPAPTTNVPPQPVVKKESKPIKVQKVPEKPVYSKIMKHKVGVGETLYRISLKYYQSGRYATYLARYNHLQNPSDLVSGTFIEIPYPPGR